MSDVVSRKTCPCTNEHCGNTLYTPTYEYDAEDKSYPVWCCTNCQQTYPRHSRKRLSNRARAIKNWQAIEDSWKETDARLHALVDAGTPSGCLLVYGRAFNFNMNKLLLGTKGNGNWDTWGVAYHTNAARHDLERAKEFVRVTENEKAKKQS